MAAGLADAADSHVISSTVFRVGFLQSSEPFQCALFELVAARGNRVKHIHFEITKKTCNGRRMHRQYFQQSIFVRAIALVAAGRA